MPRLGAWDGCLVQHGSVVAALFSADMPRRYRRGRECTRDASGIHVAVPSPRQVTFVVWRGRARSLGGSVRFHSAGLSVHACRRGNPDDPRIQRAQC
eukprot:1713644-Prymnesium_polylepis.2